MGGQRVDNVYESTKSSASGDLGFKLAQEQHCSLEGGGMTRVMANVVYTT
jgi:hypothetical protein